MKSHDKKKVEIKALHFQNQIDKSFDIQEAIFPWQKDLHFLLYKQTWKFFLGQGK